RTSCFFFQAEDGIRDFHVTGVQTCALPISRQTGLMVVPEGGALFQHNMTMVVDGHTGIEHSLSVENIYDDVIQLWSQQKDVNYKIGRASCRERGQHCAHARTWRRKQEPSKR